MNLKFPALLLATPLFAFSSHAATVSAWWDFEETSGTTINDNVANTPATLTGADLNVAGKFGSPTTGGIAFGTDQKMVIAHDDAASTQLTGDFSIAMWVNPTSLTTLDRFIDTSTTTDGGISTGGGYRLAWNNNVRFITAAGAFTSSQTLATGSWSLLIATYDVGGDMTITTIPAALPSFGAGNVAAYTSSGGFSNLAAVSYAPTSFTVIADSALGNNAYDFIGSMDDVAVLSGVLSNEEIATIYNSGVAGLVPEPSSSLLVLGSVLGLGLRRRR